MQSGGRFCLAPRDHFGLLISYRHRAASLWPSALLYVFNASGAFCGGLRGNLDDGALGILAAPDKIIGLISGAASARVSTAL